MRGEEHGNSAPVGGFDAVVIVSVGIASVGGFDAVVIVSVGIASVGGFDAVRIASVGGAGTQVVIVVVDSTSGQDLSS